MDDAFFVSGGEGVGDGFGDFEICAAGRPPGGMRRSRDWPSTSSMVRKWTPSASSTEKMVTMCGWLSAATSAGFALEAGEAIGIAGGVGGKDFEGDVAFEFGVGGAIDLAHAAGAEGGEDAVVG